MSLIINLILGENNESEPLLFYKFCHCLRCQVAWWCWINSESNCNNDFQPHSTTFCQPRQKTFRSVYCQCNNGYQQSEAHKYSVLIIIIISNRSSNLISLLVACCSLWLGVFIYFWRGDSEQYELWLLLLSSVLLQNSNNKFDYMKQYKLSM